MNSINELQEKLLQKLEKINLDNFYYFCSYNYSIGYGLLRYFKKKKYYYLIIKFFLKELINIFFINNYEIIKKNNNKKFKRIIFTWGNHSNINKEFYKDKYFNKKSSDDPNLLWIVLFNGYYDKKKLENFDNVYFIVVKKKLFISRFFSFFKFFFGYLKLEKKNFYNFLFYFNIHNVICLKLKNLYKEFLHENIDFLLMPYEGQPFQSELIKQVKKKSINSIVVGYIHSYPSFPSNLLNKKNFPDRLIISSEDQFHFFSKNVLEKDKLKLVESFRFKRRNKKLMSNKIYLPIDFFSKRDILNNLKILLSKILKDQDLSHHEICNHPVAYNSSKHLKLIKEIKHLTDITKQKEINTSQFSIFIGSTGSVLEALELGINVYHITEDPVLEVYSDFIWENIEVKKLYKNIFTYKLINKDKSIIFGSDKDKFYECFKR